MFTAPQFLSPGRRRNDLLNPAFRVTMQAVRGAKNTPCPSREPISGKGRGAFLTTGHTTDGGVAHGDQSAKEWWKERETEWKSPKTIRNNAKKFYMPFRIRKVREFDPPRVHQNWKSPWFLPRRFPRLTTEIPQTDFCFDHRKGIPCLMGMPFLLVYCPSVFEPWEPVLDRVFDTAV